MDRQIIDLPPSKFGVVTSDWYIDTRGRSAGESLSGNGQVVYSGLARWTAKLAFGTLTNGQVLAWRAAMGKLRGRVNVLRVDVCDGLGPSLDELGLPAETQALARDRGIPFNGGAYFAEGVGFAYQPTAGLSAAAPAGSQSIQVIDDASGRSIIGGRYLSIDDWLYLCTEAYSSSGARTVVIEPPLRRTITTEDRVQLRARALMVFQSDVDGRLPLDMGRWGAPSLDLVEWITRP